MNKKKNLKILKFPNDMGLHEKQVEAILFSAEEPLSIENIQERATMFIHPQESVYEGMIVGENTREQDMYVNITKGKKLTNIRASNSDISTKIIPPKIFSLEQALEFLRDGECLEVTPSTFRLRKSELQSRKHA